MRVYGTGIQPNGRSYIVIYPRDSEESFVSLSEIPFTPDASTTQELEQKIQRLQDGAQAFVSMSVLERIQLLDQALKGVKDVAERWVKLACAAKGLAYGEPESAEEWLGGPMTTMRNLRMLREALLDISVSGRPRVLKGSLSTRPDGRVVARVFPRDIYDRTLYGGFTADVWMQDDVTQSSAVDTMAELYQGGTAEPQLTLVLGAGNVASIGPMDVMHEMFVIGSVCLLKLNPVNAYVGPVLEEAFAAWIESGVMEICYGGADVGEFLCQHSCIDRIHITGSDRTHDAIVWGPAKDQAERKRLGDRYNEKPITSELGNVSPVVIVPGQWSAADLAFQAENLATMIVNNGSFNCNAAKLLVMHAEWPQKAEFLDHLRQVLAKIPSRLAYYPGAHQRYEALVSGRHDIETLGTPQSEDHLPWTLILNVDSDNPQEPIFSTEPFCSVLSETSLSAPDTASFLRAASAFCNDRVWGTLNVCLVVHPKTLKEPDTASAFDDAIAELQYGTVSVNHWPAVGYGLTVTPWGAYPGHSLEDIQSGRGIVHNTCMFARPQKTVIRGPFRVFPKPPWFVTHKRAHKVAEHLTSFEYRPSPLKLPAIIFNALFG